MNSWLGFLIAAGALPVLLACWINRRSSLIHALAWSVGAWLAWLVSAADGAILARYLALCMTACAGVAVLGARRPGAAAWNAVVAGLLAVLLIAPAQGLMAGVALPTDPIRTGFLAVALFVALVNYLPTSFGLGAMTMLGACFIELRRLGSNMPEDERVAALTLAGAAPWLAWLGHRIWLSRNAEPDQIWKDLRDRFGVVWGERVREQFNRAAHHAGLQVTMGWRGLRTFDRAPVTENERAISLDLLTALTKRFGQGD